MDWAHSALAFLMKSHIIGRVHLYCGAGRPARGCSALDSRALSHPPPLPPPMHQVISLWRMQAYWHHRLWHLPGFMWAMWARLL